MQSSQLPLLNIEPRINIKSANTKLNKFIVKYSPNIMRGKVVLKCVVIYN